MGRTNSHRFVIPNIALPQCSSVICSRWGCKLTSSFPSLLIWMASLASRWKEKVLGLSFGQTARDLLVLLFLLTHPYPKADISLAHRPLLWDPLPALHAHIKSYLMNNYQGTGTLNSPDSSIHLREWNNVSRLDTNARNTKISWFTPHDSYCKAQTQHKEPGRRKSALWG